MSTTHASITKDIEDKLDKRIEHWYKSNQVSSQSNGEYIKFLNTLRSPMSNNPVISQIVGLYIARKTIDVMKTRKIDNIVEDTNA
jgi:predicted solute-binding protein|tara:strand:+ start:140 stop:394 length:255 start_codon:yes stop_codon:yes gene_type:complete